MSRLTLSILALAVGAMLFWLGVCYGEALNASADGMAAAQVPPLRESAAEEVIRVPVSPKRETVITTTPEAVPSRSSTNGGRTLQYLGEYVDERTDPAKLRGARLEAETKQFQSIRAKAAARGVDPGEVEALLGDARPLVHELFDLSNSVDLELADLCGVRLARGEYAESDRVDHSLDPNNTAYMTFPAEQPGRYRTFAFKRNDAPRAFAALDARAEAQKRLLVRLAAIEQKLNALPMTPRR